MSNPGPDHLTTPRLILRRWRESDREPFAVLNRDPRVMEFFPDLLTPAASDQLADHIGEHFRKFGYGLYAAEYRETRSFIGFIGLATANFTAPFTPALEIGWRIAADYWGRGLATEGAREVLQYAFETLRRKEIVSFTVPANQRSRRVMKKIGMTCNPADDFDHPNLPLEHRLRRHVLYRLSRENWIRQQTSARIAT